MTATHIVDPAGLLSELLAEASPVADCDQRVAVCGC